MKGKKLKCTLLSAMLILGMAMIIMGAYPQLPKLFIDPKTYTAALQGEVFVIDVKIANVTGLSAFEFKLGYNTTLLDALDAVAGPFTPNPQFTAVINEMAGYVWVSVFCSPANGNGTLATITFKATYAESATCTLDLYDTILGDVYGTPINHDIEDGNYEFRIIDITVATDKPTYLPEENVKIHGNLTQDGSPRQGWVALEVDSPENNPIVVRTLETGPTSPLGDIAIMGVVPCDMWGTPKDPPKYKRGATTIQDLFYVKVTVKNNNPTEGKDVLIAANSYDANMIPLGLGSRKISPLSPGTTTSLVISIPIPEWASLGNAMVYANAFTDWPGRGRYGDYPLNGIPYCPEKSATFNITNGGLGAGTLGTQGLGENSTAGNYNLTFKLAPDATSGIYRVYADSFYKGQPIPNSTVFGINVICVPDHYSTIQGAVDAASPTNKSILVRPRTYNEHVTINKSVRLVGIHPSNTIIDGSGTGTVVGVAANNVEISRFTIRNSGGSFQDSGIALNNSSDSIIVENIIASNNGYGLNIHLSNNNLILSNMFSSNNYGIYLNHSNGATFRDNDMDCNNYNFGVFGDSLPDFIHDIDSSNTVDGKPVIYWKNRQNVQVPPNAGFVAVVGSTKIAVRGLDLTKNGQGVLFAFTTDSLIESVNTRNNEYGIYLVQSSGNVIIGSAVSNNNVGIYQSYCNENIICHNSFTDNTNQVDLYESSNTWNDGVGRGNYWNDYNGTDDGSNNRTMGDGVGDTLLPHQGVDWYPLMNPWILVHDVAITGVAPLIPYNASHIYPGMVVNVTVTVKNKGDFTQSFYITAYYDGNPIQMKYVTELTPLKENAITLTWDTTGVSPGNYTISANASVVPGETLPNQANNSYIDGWVVFTIVGDVNGDGRVNVLDSLILLVIRTLGKTVEEEPLADINGDGLINVLDSLMLLVIRTLTA